MFTACMHRGQEARAPATLLAASEKRRRLGPLLLPLLPLLCLGHRRRQCCL
jgi:hypothetical protein